MAWAKMARLEIGWLTAGDGGDEANGAGERVSVAPVRQRAAKSCRVLG